MSGYREERASDPQARKESVKVIIVAALIVAVSIALEHWDLPGAPWLEVGFHALLIAFGAYFLVTTAVALLRNRLPADEGGRYASTNQKGLSPRTSALVTLIFLGVLVVMSSIRLVEAYRQL